MKFLNIFILALVSCSPLNTSLLNQTPPSTIEIVDPLPPQDSSRQFERDRHKYIYEAYNFESSFTDFPANREAFDATCYVLDSDKNLVGTGTLIEPGVILTAAHVAIAVEDGYIQFDKEGICIEVSEVWMHPEWDPGITMRNDIGLLKLVCDVYDVTPLALANYDTNLYRYVSDVFTIGCSLAYKKQSLPDTIFYYGTLLSSPAELKLRSTVSTIWFGDSGGPAVLRQKDGTVVVVGVVVRFAMFQSSIMDFTAVDVREFTDQLNTIIDLWELDEI